MGWLERMRLGMVLIAVVCALWEQNWLISCLKGDKGMNLKALMSAFVDGARKGTGVEG
jgi:hypothetical protein